MRSIVSSHNAMAEALATNGAHLHTLTTQVAVLGEKLLAMEEGFDDLDARVGKLEKKRG